MRPLAGAYVDIWHCDAKGIYSDESGYNPSGGTGPVNTSGQKFLRGYHITDASGQVTFATIYPGWYSGRTIHIHFRVRTYSGSSVSGNFVSQVFFDEAVNNSVLSQGAYSRTSSRDTSNSSDMVYNVTNRERMLATVAGDATNGYVASITADVSLAAPAVTLPAIASGGIGNSVSGAAGIAHGSWVSIYGTNVATASQVLSAGDLVNNTLPTTLGGVSVQINGKAAFLQYVSPTQLNALAPADAGSGTVAVTVTKAAGSSNSGGARVHNLRCDRSQRHLGVVWNGVWANGLQRSYGRGFHRSVFGYKHSDCNRWRRAAGAKLANQGLTNASSASLGQHSGGPAHMFRFKD